ncbi:MAG: pyridoxal phosphate-dependent aminotransferase family protein [Bdellovibrionales bacterium]|nr:pyridoxal phosphate-dependent aminotransferase family protein [Bdellovibrionales bacterium]
MTLKKLQAQADQLHSLGSLKERIPSSARSASSIVIRGKKLFDFTNWDLFDLRSDHVFKRAAQSAIESQGISAGSARLVSGSSKIHDVCEQRLASFFGFDDALLFSSKNQAVLSLVTSLCGQGDLVLYEDGMISPVADAAYLSEVANIAIDINDVTTLRSELERSKFYQGRFIFLESLSVNSGKAIDIVSLVALAREFQAVIFLDESYAVGMRGIRGSGICEEHQLDQELLGVYCDLSLASSCYGAVVASSQAVCELLLSRSRTFSNEVAYPNCIASGVVAALDHLELQHSGRERIRRLVEQLSTACLELGFRVLNDDGGPLVIVGTESGKLALAIQEALFQKGFLVESTAPRKLRSEIASVRFVINQAHSEKMVESLIRALAEIKSHLKL